MLRRWMVTMVLLSGVAMAGAGSFVEARQADAAHQAFEAARRVEVIDRDLRGAIVKYRDVVTRYAFNRAVAANALVRLAACYQQLGQPEATATYQRVVREFADQPTAVAAARAAMAAARPAAATTQTTLVRRVVYEDSNWNAVAVSPDGRFALGWGGIANNDLILRTLPAKDDRVLLRQAPPVSRVDNPVFSANGAFVAFSWTGSDVQESIGVVATSTSSQPTRLAARGLPLGWSPDGSAIIALQIEPIAEGRPRPRFTVSWINSSSGSIVRSVTLPDGGYYDLPRVSPDGAYIAYERATAVPIRESRIYTMDSSGRNEAEVVRLAGRNRQPVWTSDGSAILFVSNRTGRDGLWAIRMQGAHPFGEPLLIHESPAWGVLSGVTVDGSAHLLEALPPRQHVFISERGTSGARGLRAFNGEGVSWSPDGASVAFIKNDGTDLNNSLIIKNLATGDERSFDHPSRLGNAQVRWAADGRSILVNIREVGVHVFDVRSGQFRKVPVAEGRVRAGVADVSADGKTIFVPSRPAGGTATGGPFTELVAVDAVTGVERKLIDFAAIGHMGTGSPSIAVSPDGQQIALQVRLSQMSDPEVMARLVLVAADGSGSRNLTAPYRTRFIPSTITWTPDGQSVLYFTGSAQQSTWRLTRVSVGGGEPVFDGLERAALQSDSSLPILAPPPPLSLTVSPDGSRVAFGAYAGASNQLVALDNVNAVIARAR